MSMMVSFVLSFFPRDVLDEILNLIESVSEDFPSYSYVIPSELLSVYPSVCPSVRTSVRPSAVDHSCPLRNFDTVQDNFTKLGRNIKHDQTTCRD